MEVEATMPEATGTVNSHKPVVSSPEESDGVIVPEKLANKGVTAPAEQVEGRTPTKRNSGQEAAHRTQKRERASNQLARVRQRAEADKTIRFNNLFRFLKVDLLRESFYELKRKAAPGLDGVTWYEYERTL
jgi:RNA-directed DNA polymerase